MLNFFKRQLFNSTEQINTTKELQSANSKSLQQSISELERFTKGEMNQLLESNKNAFTSLEQIANNIKGLLSAKNK